MQAVCVLGHCGRLRRAISHFIEILQLIRQDYCVRQAVNHTICFAYCNPLVIIIISTFIKRKIIK